MIVLRASQDRGHAQLGWLDSYHSFSFSSYYDPNFMGFHDLRVINEDRIAGGKGFATHPHKDMEIITYVIAGELAHKDTLGNSTRIRPGEVQRMSAGTGIEHSEYNSKENEMTHLLQIWILPEAKNLEPGYGQKSFASELEKNDLTLTVSRSGREGSIHINQDVDLYVGKWSAARECAFTFRAGRKGWIQVVSGPLQVNHLKMTNGDGLAISDERDLKIKSEGSCEFLLFDLP